MNRIIDQIIDLSNEKIELPEYLYHYTSIDVIDKIFNKNALMFKLTNVSNFTDTTEGECYKVYYDIALEELEKENNITKEERLILDKIQPYETGFLFGKQGERFFESKPSDTYIGCFSMKKADKYMIENYIKNSEHSGVCIELFANSMKNLSNDYYGYNFSILKVMYGREVIDSLKKFIIILKYITGGISTDSFRKYGIGTMSGKLTQIIYMAKLSKFRPENEYRIVLQVPKVVPDEYEIHRFNHVGTGLIYELPHYCFSDIDFYNMRKTQIKSVKNVLNNYNLHSLCGV